MDLQKNWPDNAKSEHTTGVGFHNGLTSQPQSVDHTQVVCTTVVHSFHTNFASGSFHEKHGQIYFSLKLRHVLETIEVITDYFTQRTFAELS